MTPCRTSPITCTAAEEFVVLVLIRLPEEMHTPVEVDSLGFPLGGNIPVVDPRAKIINFNLCEH